MIAKRKKNAFNRRKIRNTKKQMTKFKENTISPRHSPMLRPSTPSLIKKEPKQPNHDIQNIFTSKGDITNKFSLHSNDKKEDGNVRTHKLKFVENDPGIKVLNEDLEENVNHSNQNSGVCRDDKSGNIIEGATDDKEDKDSNIGNDNGHKALWP